MDHLLARLIESFIVDNRDLAKQLLKGPLAPISSFSARILLAFTLGLIAEDEYHDLEVIREIRNMYAHQLTN